MPGLRPAPVRMPEHANIPYEWQIGATKDGRLAFVVPSWSKKDKLSYAIFMDLDTRELECECRGHAQYGECHHVHGAVWFCAGPRHRKKGVQPTSVEAFISIQADLPERRKKVLEKLQEVGRASNKELSILLKWPINCVTPRVKELRDMGIVDYDSEQPSQGSNKTECVWAAVC